MKLLKQLTLGATLFALAGTIGYAQSSIEHDPLLDRKKYLITDYGAVGDESTINTKAIQRAIDTASQAGGGVVVIPEGVFRSGSIFIKPGVGLHLEKGGVLQGSQQLEDYPKRNTRIEGHFEPWRMALVNAQHVDQLRITGEGLLDGNGEPFWAAFWQRREENPDCTNLEVERPRMMFIDQCKDVLIEGISLQDSGFWNIHVYRSQDVTISGVSITSPNGTPPDRAPSSDGIDIDSCQRVTVRDCFITVGDDCIAIKGTKGPRALEDESSPPVEDILIENCRFDSGHGVVTLGSEATIVRNVVVRDCVVTGWNKLVRLKLRPDTPQTYENLLYENIVFEAGGGIFDVKPWTQFFDLKGEEPPRSVVRNVTIRNVKGWTGKWGELMGNPLDTIEDITIENLEMKIENEAITLGPVDGLKVKNVVVNGKRFESL
ncbi:right-handed parallel beta-helix repeat-containing protein [Pelagicoccus sp. NFK12]|uniref:Right-handed parallel beta-helix repeat-containing protein n=1 Tax=Pelagicoccus enzymogenes TaxID=2773457 RepID=A0A927IHP5_9BACT|nr:glycosyl hydrolase family 28 protein [Pelagicoccus enzymogenes]MBD5780421.1 right-handed parallel beta-helix repeat-containing protein [Pelagicoccus enzymogenes]